MFFNRKEKVLEKLKTGLKKAKRAVSVVGGKLGQSQGSKAKSVASVLTEFQMYRPMKMV